MLLVTIEVMCEVMCEDMSFTVGDIALVNVKQRFIFHFNQKFGIKGQTKHIHKMFQEICEKS